jgi:hypothetical protein
MGKKQEAKDEPKGQPLRTDEARQVAEEYAEDQREILEKLRKPSRSQFWHNPAYALGRRR